MNITAPHLFVQASVCQCVKGSCTGWDEIFHCHHTSEAWLAGGGPSRCSATPRGWAPHPPTHNSTHTHNNNYQQSLSGGDILLATRHGGSVSGVRAAAAARSHRVNPLILEKTSKTPPTHPPFFLTQYKDEVTSEKAAIMGTGNFCCFGSRTHKGAVLISQKWNSKIKPKMSTMLRTENKAPVYQLNQNKLASSMRSHSSPHSNRNLT